MAPAASPPRAPDLTKPAGRHMNLLALDLATQVGWMLREVDRPIRFGSIPFRGPLGPALSAYRKWLIERLDQATKPIRVVYEMPFVGGKPPKKDGAGGSRGHTSQAVARKLMSMAGITDMVASEIPGVDPEPWEVNNASVRKHFIGIGRGKREVLKAKTMAEAIRRGFNVGNDDEADAIAVGDYAAHCFKLPGLTPGGLFS